LFYRRGRPLCLHYGFERLRPIMVVEAVTALSRRLISDGGEARASSCL